MMTTTTTTTTTRKTRLTVWVEALTLTTLLAVALVLMTLGNSGVELVEGVTCSVYRSAVERNELAFPKNPGYSPQRKYFGAPAICDNLSGNKTFFVPENGTDREDVEQQAFAMGFGLGTLTDECRIPAAKLLCASAFRECQYQQISPSLPNFFG